MTTATARAHAAAEAAAPTAARTPAKEAAVHDGRRPTWSHFVTVPMARAIPEAWRPATLAAIKAIHTAIFASVGAAIVIFTWEGIRGRASRRAAMGLGVAIGEAAVYVSNNQVCPLTPLAEELGAERGSVADIYLPSWLSRRIPVISVSMLLIGLGLNLRARLARSSPG